MNHRAHFQAWLISTLCALPLTSNATQLHVMLQGNSAGELAELVTSTGGSISHELPIIDAVGAYLTRHQLEKILESPLVTRHIDDLLVQEDEDPEQKSSCDVGAALQLAFEESDVSWALFNKQPSPATLRRIKLQWPQGLGDLQTAHLGSHSILTGRAQEKWRSDGLDLVMPAESTLAIKGQINLELKFSHPLQGANDLLTTQNDFAFTVEFDGNCVVNLVPAYADNHHNFYYAGMAGADALHRHGVTGRGVTVAVLDSGLWEHPALANDSSGKHRVVARYDAITGQEVLEALDESGHGTHMTSILAHSGPTVVAGEPDGSFKGIAPDVELIAIKAFDVKGQGDLLDIVRGIQWVVEHRENYDIRVLNLSFAARPRWDYWQDPINQAVMQAWAQGITVVAAAGNEGPGDMTVGTPGNLPYVITVGAITDSWTPDDRDDDYIPDFSSRGPTPNAHIKPDIVAPGGHMTGLTRPGSTLALEHPEYQLQTGEFVMTGSSQAAALVSGIAALLLQLEPGLSPDDIKCKLTSSAEPAINSDGLLAYSPFQQGHGLVNATRAVTLGRTGCGNDKLDIVKDIQGTEHYQGPAVVTETGAVSLPGLTAMLSPEEPAKGPSKTRKWGVKAHIEREESGNSAGPQATDKPFDWWQMYEEERARIEELSRTAPTSQQAEN